MYFVALDAYCLLEIYEFLCKKVVAVDPKFDLEPTLDSTRKSASAVIEEEVDMAYREVCHVRLRSSSNPPKLLGPPTKPKDLSIIVDYMFQGLGRQLRVCGVDMAILSNEQSRCKMVKIAIRENRIILTSGKSFFWARNQVPDQLCYHVMTKKPQDQVKEVLEYFNVQVTKHDIFSRCQVRCLYNVSN